MKINDFIKSVSIMTALAISASVFAAEIPPPVSLTPAGTQLEAQYSKMLATRPVPPPKIRIDSFPSLG